MGKRENPLDRFTEPTPENQAGQVNNHGKPLRAFFLATKDRPASHVGRTGKDPG